MPAPISEKKNASHNNIPFPSIHSSWGVYLVKNSYFINLGLISSSFSGFFSLDDQSRRSPLTPQKMAAPNSWP
jgi:hypothetical protein